MLTLASIINISMCWISNWYLLWPLKMLIEVGLGDKLIAIGWSVLFVTAL